MLYNQEHTDLCKNIRFLYFRKIKSNSIQCSLLIHRLLLLKFISNWWIHIGAPEVWISLNSEWRGIDSNYKQRPTNLACISEERKSYTNCNPGKKKTTHTKIHNKKATTTTKQTKNKTKPNQTKNPNQPWMLKNTNKLYSLLSENEIMLFYIFVINNDIEYYIALHL